MGDADITNLLCAACGELVPMNRDKCARCGAVLMSSQRRTQRLAFAKDIAKLGKEIVVRLQELTQPSTRRTVETSRLVKAATLLLDSRRILADVSAWESSMPPQDEWSKQVDAFARWRRDSEACLAGRR